ncbi:hypothetical protein [Sporosarcina sp. FSL K6-1508]|uniref:hypothetical protein n=1 Tax=Sporosarcina sp. FSL K6-1508 TaxID=2921553 RepID=UPI0030F5E27C
MTKKLPIERRIVLAISKMESKSKSYIIAHDFGNADNTGNKSLEGEIKYRSSNWRMPEAQF